MYGPISHPAYPAYLTYETARLQPSVLEQDYPRPAFSAGETYYPPNLNLAPYLSSDVESSKFGAACFCGFLEDTIDVEQCLVIPAVAAVRRLPYEIPEQAEQDLYKTATDEGFHAEQSLQYLSDLRIHFGLPHADAKRTPLFLRRLADQCAAATCELHRDLITVLNGVVTETRISIELSRFASDSRLAPTVRQICRLHSRDEAIHASQFKALGKYLWSVFDGTTRAACAEFLIASTIARSMPDIDRLIGYLHQATGRDLADCVEIVCNVYSAKMLVEEMMIAAKPTVAFVSELGVLAYASFDNALKAEEQRQERELIHRREAKQPVLESSVVAEQSDSGGLL